MSAHAQEIETPTEKNSVLELVEPNTGAVLKVALMLVTPALALEWLKRNVNFRKIKPVTVVRYAAAMTKQRWDVTGDTIKFYANGDLKDGQHRLEACIQSGVSFVALVVWGIQSDMHIDIHTPRNLGQKLENRGEANAKALAATLRLVWKWENAKLTDSYFTGEDEDHLEALERHPNIRRSVSLANAAEESLLESSSAAFLHYTFARKHTEQDADRFFDAFFTGAELSKQDPIFQLRKRLRDAKEIKDKRMTKLEKMAATLKAWNLWINGKPCPSGNSLRWRQYGPTAEPFPAHMISLEESVAAIASGDE